jgi:hypothetical protein
MELFEGMKSAPDRISFGSSTSAPSGSGAMAAAPSTSAPAIRFPGFLLLGALRKNDQECDTGEIENVLHFIVIEPVKTQ